MRTIFFLWLFPIVFFWGWHFLSFYDVGGAFFLTKDFNTHIYTIYGNILQMPAADVPMALAWIFFVDSIILFFGVAIIAWWKSWFYPLVNFFRTRVFGLEPKVFRSKKEKAELKKQEALDKIDNTTPIGPVHPAE